MIYKLSVNGVKLEHKFELSDYVKRKDGEVKFSPQISRFDKDLQYIAFAVKGNEKDVEALEDELCHWNIADLTVEYENGEAYTFETSVDMFRMELDGDDEEFIVLLFAVGVYEEV